MLSNQTFNVPCYFFNFHKIYFSVFIEPTLDTNLHNDPLEGSKTEEEKGSHQNLGGRSYLEPDLGSEPESDHTKQLMEAEDLDQENNYH